MILKKNFPHLYIQVGGGIRNLENIQMYLDNGIDRIILGTKAVKNLDFISTLKKEIQKKIIVDIAIKDGKLAIEGWNQLSTHDTKTFINNLKQYNISEIVFTDINRDGMLSGINFTVIEDIVKFSDIPVIASGGISSIDDIKKLIPLSKFGLSGVIVGKALYEKKINLTEAINLFGS